ncbi:MAG: hypothetical protein WC909_01830 [Candidatus Paceibacterota bacterium]|jgi:hypothetical protein
MSIIKNLLAIIGFLALIIIFLIIVNPFGIDMVKVVTILFSSEQTSTYDHPYLNTEQEALLESAGIDTTKIPTTVTAEQQECAISILGEERVNEIINGSLPSVIEIFQAKGCFF